MAPPVTASWPRSERLRSRSMVLMGWSSLLMGRWPRSRLAPRSGPPVAMSRPTSSLLAVRPSTTATMRPRYMTRDAVGELQDLVQLGRDEQHGRARRHACAMTCWWMNSMLPTSRPRVGWSSTSSLQVAAELAGHDEPSAGCRRRACRPCTWPTRRAHVELLDGLARPVPAMAASSRTMPLRVGLRVVVGQDDVVRERKESTRPKR